MKIIEKLSQKQQTPVEADIPTIVFIGDSVTQGCFEIYMTGDNSLETVYEADKAYHACIWKMFKTLYPKSPLNIINAGISGDKSWSGYKRLKKDVLRYNPDLVVVCFGLNDSCTGEGKMIEEYKEALANIFEDVKKSGSDVIFMTGNMMNTYVPYKLQREEFFRLIAESCMECETSGRLEKFFNAGIEVAKAHNVPVCDVYSKWRKLYASGVDTTMLLSNDVNHPTREMHWLFAYSLMETIFAD